MSEPGPQGQADDDLVDLLLKRITEGLSPDEQRALDGRDDAASGAQLRDLERTVAAISLAAAGTTLPPALRVKLERDADAFIARTKPTPIGAAAAIAKPAVPPPYPARASNAGWFAAAACLVLAVFGWLRTPPASAPPVAAVPSAPAPAAPAEPQAPVVPTAPTPADQRLALMARSDTLKITLAATKDPAAGKVTGDVVWDPQAQRGFMHFVGLKANDPKVREYQLWIFDGERDQRYPIDGGVFDIPADSGEVVIPIHAAILVRKAAAFAVTVEKPGGVVVSAREHVVALGAAG